MTSPRLLILALVSIAASPLQQTESAVLRPAGAIPLNVEGRIDHLSVDLEAKRLFVAALGNNTLEVVDLTAMRVARSIRGLDEPQGIRYLPEARRVAVANGGNGAVVFFESNSFGVSRTTKLSGDADNVRYDPAAGRVYVGYASGAIAVLDAEGKVLGDIRLAGHPESFQLETTGPRIFVNVPQAGQIAVIDRNKRAVIATWPVAEARANYPMALDERHRRLLVGCRSPSRLIVYDTDTGRPVTALDIVGDTDDLFYDSATQRIYVAGGAGFITVIQQQDADHYRTIQTLATAAGARTALFVPELRRLFLAVPHRGNQRAEVRMYAADN